MKDWRHDIADVCNTDDGDVMIAVRRSAADLQEMVNHLAWLLQGKCYEVRRLRRNIGRVCTQEQHMRIVED